MVFTKFCSFKTWGFAGVGITTSSECFVETAMSWCSHSGAPLFLKIDSSSYIFFYSTPGFVEDFHDFFRSKVKLTSTIYFTKPIKIQCFWTRVCQTKPVTSRQIHRICLTRSRSGTQCNLDFLRKRKIVLDNWNSTWHMSTQFSFEKMNQWNSDCGKFLHWNTRFFFDNNLILISLWVKFSLCKLFFETPCDT